MSSARCAARKDMRDLRDKFRNVGGIFVFYHNMISMEFNGIILKMFKVDENLDWRLDDAICVFFRAAEAFDLEEIAMGVKNEI